MSYGNNPFQLNCWLPSKIRTVKVQRTLVKYKSCLASKFSMAADLLLLVYVKVLLALLFHVPIKIANMCGIFQATRFESTYEMFKTYIQKYFYP